MPAYANLDLAEVAERSERIQRFADRTGEFSSIPRGPKLCEDEVVKKPKKGLLSTVKVSRKKAGDAAVEAWRAAEREHEANEIIYSSKKPTKKEKPQITEKILTVLKAIGGRKFDQFFTEKEINQVVIIQDERKKFMKKLNEKKKCSWFKTVATRWKERSYYSKEIKNIKLLNAKRIDLDYVIAELNLSQQQTELNSAANSLEILNECYDKQIHTDD
uniref:Uncharacterized protein n=1 Tax=Panagrolaimus sp. ES5 TaxID=591445 RepID=A0AC34F164_9BILA